MAPKVKRIRGRRKRAHVSGRHFFFPEAEADEARQRRGVGGGVARGGRVEEGGVSRLRGVDIWAWVRQRRAQMRHVYSRAHFQGTFLGVPLATFASPFVQPRKQ